MIFKSPSPPPGARGRVFLGAHPSRGQLDRGPCQGVSRGRGRIQGHVEAAQVGKYRLCLLVQKELGFKHGLQHNYHDNAT